jgi:cation-transporting ATPase 13A3/4/5
MTYVLIADPNPVGCLFRVNCGTKEALMDLGYSVNFSVPPVFHSAFGHNVFPLQFRLIIWGIMFLNLITLVIWESIIQWFSPQWNS